MKTVKFTVFIVFFVALCVNAYSQRCGDGILFSFKKSGQRFLDSADLKISLKTFDRRFKYYNDPGHTEMLLDTISDTAAYVTYVNEINGYFSAKDSNKIYTPTLCGFFRMEFTFTDLITGETMKLIIHKIPHDTPINLNDIVFKKGEYEFNFNWVVDAIIFKENKKGVYSFDFSNFRSL
ncbi:MAG: hypothetical protein ABI543_00635 [Ignavibacteria bacterium]